MRTRWMVTATVAVAVLVGPVPQTRADALDEVGPAASPSASAEGTDPVDVDDPAGSLTELAVEIPSPTADVGARRLPSAEADSSDLLLQTPLDDTRVVSQVFETQTFQTVGMTWPVGADVTGLAPQIRTRADGVWSDWVALETTDETPDAGTPDAMNEDRAGTPSVWVSDAQAVQLSAAITPDGGPSGLELALVASGTVDVPAGLSSSVQAVDLPTTPPRVITRGEWGARAQACTPDVAQRVVGVVVHHTAGPNSYASVADAMAQIRNDQRYHIESRGWCDIGYNFLVDKWGNVYEGRANSINRPVIGVHAGGFNTGTVGIAMLGDFSTVAPSSAMLAGVGQIAAWRLAAYQVDPRSTITYQTGGGENSRYPAGAVVQLPAIFSHRDVGTTACPGNAGYAGLGQVRQTATDWYLAWPEWTSGPSVSPQMRLLWDRWGGPDGPIGVPTASQRCDLSPEGCVQQFSGAAVYWSPQTGAQAVGGLLLTRWKASGGPAAGIGYPTSSVFGCPASGCTQTFQSGVVTWSPGTGAQVVGGVIYRRYAALGGSDTLGYPSTTVLGCDATAGCTQVFTRARIAWSGATGAQAIGGILGSTWTSLGGATGTLGYPTTSQLGCDATAGCVQAFRNGAIAWKGTTGARAMSSTVATEWIARGAGQSIGYPLETVLTCGAGGCVQRFERGVAVAATGHVARLVGGVILNRWKATGGLTSPLGLPTTTVLSCDPAAGCFQLFDRGAVAWSSRTGAQAVPGPIQSRWRLSGGAAAVGYPVQSVTSCAAGVDCVQLFERATATWSSATGAHLVGGVIRSRWNATGGAGGPLGLPTSTVLACDPVVGCTQTFEGGQIRWTAATGAVVGS